MKRLFPAVLTACFLALSALPVSAYEYTIDPPNAYSYGKPTSVETVYTADGGKQANEDVSKNAALIPPGFGTPGMNVMNYGEYLTPFLAPGGQTVGSIGGAAQVVYPSAIAAAETVPASTVTVSTAPASVRHTSVTNGLYYSDGSLGTLNIPAISLTVKIYQGTVSAAMAKGAGHFEESSIWEGNVALASHNRGSSSYFSGIHTLSIGDRITLTTKLGARTYAVTAVSKVSETDRSALAETAENRITLYTCVTDQPAYRWCVQATELV